MKRQRRTVRCISRVGDDYVDRTVTFVAGGRKPIVMIKKVIHAHYECVEVLVSELVDAGEQPPEHDAVYIDVEGWTYQYLKRIR